MRKQSYLWVIALVALCLSLGSGMALAGPAPSWIFDSDNIPSELTWDATSDVTVNIVNGGDVEWDSTFGLESVQGITGAAFPINRWGLTQVRNLGPTVPTGNALAAFEFTITGPPITSLRYDVPVGPTAPGSESEIAFDCNWILASGLTPTSTGGTLIPTDTVIAPVVMSRFADVQATPVGANFRFWVEQLFGTVPFIVQGFGDGSYRPKESIIRGQMASFIRRAMKLPTEPYEAKFPATDVDPTSPHVLDIEALVRAGVVQGFMEPDGTFTFRPFTNVTRDQMAVFIARGVVRGPDSAIPTGPSPGVAWPQDFDDVPPTGAVSSWAFNQLEFLFHNNQIVQGFTVPPHGIYRPSDVVDRGSMAIFVWRAFVRPSGTPVVVAGPAFSSLDPTAVSYNGISSITQAPLAEPGFAYVAFDAVRLNTNLVFPATPTGTWSVLLELVPVTSPTAPTVAQLFTRDAVQVAAAHAFAISTGDPYLYFVFDLSEAPELAKGQYDLVAFATDETGAFFEISSVALPAHQARLRFTVN